MRLPQGTRRRCTMLKRQQIGHGGDGEVVSMVVFYSDEIDY